MRERLGKGNKHGMCIPTYKGLLTLVFVSFSIKMYAGEGLIKLSHAVMYLGIRCIYVWRVASYFHTVVGSILNPGKLLRVSENDHTASHSTGHDHKQ